jgi:signal transduction histidine kinase
MKLAQQRERQALTEASAADARARAEEELRQSVMILAGSIAHDMRTPLATIRILSNIIQKLNGILLTNYELAQQAGLANLLLLNKTQHDKVISVPDELKRVVDDMNEYINVSLRSLSRILAKELQPEDLEVCDADRSINHTISRYPFNTGERERIHLDTQYQFTFMGNQLLIFRVLSNLIKNALYEIDKDGIGDIFIITCDAGKFNEIIVRDTAGRISHQQAKTIFDGYKTTKIQGTGVGLAFCKLTMESFGGAIRCETVDDQYVELILSFPKINSA